MILIGNGRAITWNKDKPYLSDGCVAVEGSEIVGLGATPALKAQYPHAEFYDARRRVIMPGLINAHTHIYSSFARGLFLPQSKPNRNFSEILKNLWWRIDKVLDENDNLYSAYAAGLESVRCGVTTLFDHHASQRHVTGSLPVMEQALSGIGLRACLCYEVSDRDGPETAERAIRENLSFIIHTEMQDTSLIKGMFGLHASFTLSPETLEKCAAAMNGRRAGYHIHAAESVEDLIDSMKKYNKRVIHRLYDAKILGEKTLAIHNVHVNGEDFELLAATKTMAVHNPESNMSNAVGCAPALEMMRKGVLTGLGTDAYTQDMFESLKAANLIHKHVQADPSAGFAESMEMLFINNAAIAAHFWEKPLGVLREGAYADLIVLDYNPPTPMNAASLAGHIMFGMSGRAVASTMVNGRWIMKERVMQTVDEVAIMARCRAQCADFWKRVTA